MQMRDVARLFLLLGVAIATRHPLCSMDIQKNSACMGPTSKLCDWLREKQHRICDPEVGEAVAPERSRCVIKPASSTQQAAESNYKIIDAFFANEALIRRDGKPSASPKAPPDTMPDTPAVQHPKGTNPKSWCGALPKAGAAPVFDSHTAFLFNSMWKHGFSTPDYQLSGLPNSLSRSGNSSSAFNSEQA